MKTLSITLAVNATNTTDAEKIAQRELMYMAKTIAQHCGGAMGSGNGNTTRVFDCIYKIDAEVQVDCNGNINDIAKRIQSTWADKKEIVSSMIFVNEPEVEEKTESKAPSKPICDICLEESDDLYCVHDRNGETSKMCVDCLEYMIDNDVVRYCENCETYVKDCYEHPMTHKKTICPNCGENI